ncbi:MAG TPA: glycoside hydrolase family 15 protein [Vicinamibacterales bacterium]|nr:glycoside hydrolase family 15 protein [Vicinamibacterales bacterium]
MPSDAGDYLPIEAYGLIGDGRTAALVSRDGSIDWACFPRFDSPSVFARILDARRGGAWRLSPAGKEIAIARAYVPDTNVLSTVFRTPTGEVELLDGMPRPDLLGAGHGSAIVRIVRGRAGEVTLETTFEPRFDYARGTAEWSAQPGTGVRALWAGHDEGLTLYTAAPLAIGRDGAAARFVVRAGEEVPFVLVHRAPAPAIWRHDVLPVAARALEQTMAYWRDWIARCSYRGPWAAHVRRSLLALKLLEYSPTGARVAAPTTSLPERIGGVRNWDYRYAWIRDTAFMLYAFYLTGYPEEGEAFFDWALSVAGDDPARLQVVYGVGGEKALPETELPHLEGYRRSRPVRIGNDAYRQRQLDLFGDLVDCAYLAQKYGRPLSPELWPFLRALVDHVCEAWREPDRGIWEIRSPEPRHFVYSKGLCWVAVDRGLRIARAAGLPADLERWERTRAEIKAEILARGYSPRLQAFAQAYEVEEYDAANLALQLRKVLPADEPHMRSTVEHTYLALNEHGLLRRYAPHVDDGLPPGEGVFLMCTFWIVDCWAEAGRVDEAVALFERLLGYATDLGLYAEEYDPVEGRHLGNFPQAFTHVALVNAACQLARVQESAGR